MFAGHNPYLVALSLVIAILGGYTGFGLAARIRATGNASRRLLLAGAATFLAVGIWTMHFIGVLAAPIPPDAVYLVLPTFVSFLICALVVGVSLFFVSIGEPSDLRVLASALLLGSGIVSMHYVGIHALQGNFSIMHNHLMVIVSVIIAVGAAYGGLRIYLARQGGLRLALSAVAFGIAVSGMHYTAMYGMRFEPMHAAGMAHMTGLGLVASAQALSLIVALLCFFIAAGFLLFLVPDARPRALATSEGDGEISATGDWRARRPAIINAPLAGLGQPPQPATSRVPVESADGTHFIDVAEIRGIRADAHYTLVNDGTRERMCSWAISEAEAQLSSGSFMRVHRSHIVALSHITFIRRDGDGAVVELDGPVPHLVPVSRAKIAELRSRLGLARRNGASAGNGDMGHDP